MKKKYMMLGILLLVVLLVLLLVTVLINTKQEDLFKQEQEDNIIAQAEEGKAQDEDANVQKEDALARSEDISLPANDTTEKSEINSGENDIDDLEYDTLNDSIEEAVDNSIIEEDSDNKQQEASMETLGQNELQLFYYEEIKQEIKDRINGKSYGENCTVPYEELRYVKVLHWGFDGQVHEGELIVNKAIAEDIVEIFKELYEEKYPIEQMVLVDEFDADDNTSMDANNSSAFNFRVIEGTNRVSLHSYGLAIDINPLYNPYVHELEGEILVTPVNGAEYEDRTLDCHYYIEKDDICYKAFINRGFTWGGEWTKQKDYQHFQKVKDTN